MSNKRMAVYSGNVAEPENVAEKPVHITSLPTEILTTIFAMMDTRSKGRCASVCREWLDVCYQKAVWRDEAFLWSSKYAEGWKENPTLPASLERRKIRRVELTIGKEDGDVNLRDVAAGVLKTLPKMTLTGLTITDNIPFSCTNIVGAHQQIRHVVKLDLAHSNIKVHHRFVKFITRSFRKLAHLSLPNCHHLDRVSLARLCGPWNKKEGIDSCAVIPMLEHLELAGCRLLSNDNLLSLRKCQPRLKCLRISNALMVDNHGLLYLAKMKQLKELWISGSSDITDGGVARFTRKNQNNLREMIIEIVTINNRM